MFGVMEVPDKIIEVAIKGAYTVVVAGVSVFGTWKVAHRNGRNGKAKHGNDKNDSGCPKEVQAAHAATIAAQGSSIEALKTTCEDIRKDVRRANIDRVQDMRHVNDRLDKILGRLPKE